MRLRRLLPFAAALALAGCNAQPDGKGSETARTKISPAPAAEVAAAPKCPPAPACAPEKAAMPAAARKASARKPVRAQPAVYRTSQAKPGRRVYSTRRHDDLAGGPPGYGYHRWDGEGPKSGYHYRRYGEGGYRYGALPPPPPPRAWRDEDERDWAYDDPRRQRRYDERPYHGRRDDEGRRYEGRRYDDGRYDDRRYEEPRPRPPEGPGYYYRHGGEGRMDRDDHRARHRGPYDDSARAERPHRRHRHHAEDMMRPDSGARTVERYSTQESGGERREGAYARGGSIYDYEAHREAERSASGYRERRTEGDSRWMRAESQSRESTSSSYAERTSSVDDGCCAPQSRTGAAGFDRNGYLTWPGKVPARP